MFKKLILFILLVGFLFVVLDQGLGFLGKSILEIKPIVPVMSDVSTDEYNELPKNTTKEFSGPKGPFTLSTNEYGMRMGRVSIENVSQTTRIAVMGDAAALAYGLDQEQGFSVQLETLLNKQKPSYEVLNFAGLHTSSYQMKQKYDQLVQKFEPDLLILAIGPYDAFETKLTDAEYFELIEQHEMVPDNTSWLSFFSRYSSAAYWFQQNLWQKKKKRFQQALAKLQQRKEWVERVAENQTIQLLQSIIENQHSRGGKTILMNLNLLNYHRVNALQTLSQTNNIPLLDIRKFFDTLGGREERQLAIQKNLEPTAIDTIQSTNSRLLVRIHVSRELDHPIHVLGNHPALQSTEQKAILLNDEGDNGDERRSDSVWSSAIEIENAKTFEFAFLEGKPSDNDKKYQNKMQREWKNQLIYYRFHPPAINGAIEWRSPVFRLGEPIYSHLVMRGDPSLPNALAHRAIARRLAGLIKPMKIEEQTITHVSSK